MNIPLNWLSQYVSLPATVGELTDKLTLIGHMLDKTFEIDGEQVIDLELRGNRADLFGLIGIAREVSTCWNTPLTFPKKAKLPPVDPTSHLVTVEANDLVERFVAFTLKVNVGPTPAYIVKHLATYGIGSINNVVDITNYVMVETGEPMHAYDFHKLTGNRLILRRAKKGEHLKTLQGTDVSLAHEDLVISDEKFPQGLTMIGGYNTRVSDKTTHILLEAAVYHQANVRRTARRLGIRTEAGNRHEKHLDPHIVATALERALYLLQEHAGATLTSDTSDYYPNPKTPFVISLPAGEVERLTGIAIPEKEQTTILTRLGCKVKRGQDQSITLTVPTFRTDITTPADVVEEIVRIVGYDTVPSLTLGGQLPKEQSSPRIKQEEKIRATLVQLQFNEVITSSFLKNSSMEDFHIQEKSITLANAPDPEMATLRPTLVPNLVLYAKRMLDMRASRIALFEIGKVYHTPGVWKEERRLGIILGGGIDTKSYGKTPRPLTFFDGKGIVESLTDMLGLPLSLVHADSPHGSLDPIQQATIAQQWNNGTMEQSGNKHVVGSIGKLHDSVAKLFGIKTDLFLADLSLDLLIGIPKIDTRPYSIAPQYPPTIEDFSFSVSDKTRVGDLIETITSLDPLISEVSLLDTYEDKRTLRVVYQDPSRTLSSEDTKPVREKILDTAKKQFQITPVV